MARSWGTSLSRNSKSKRSRWNRRWAIEPSHRQTRKRQERVSELPCSPICLSIFLSYCTVYGTVFINLSQYLRSPSIWFSPFRQTVHSQRIVVQCGKCSRKFDAEEFEKHWEEVHSDREDQASVLACRISSTFWKAQYTTQVECWHRGIGINTGTTSIPHWGRLEDPRRAPSATRGSPKGTTSLTSRLVLEDYELITLFSP